MLSPHCSLTSLATAKSLSGSRPIPTWCSSSSCCTKSSTTTLLCLKSISAPSAGTYWKPELSRVKRSLRSAAFTLSRLMWLKGEDGLARFGPAFDSGLKQFRLPVSSELAEYLAVQNIPYTGPLSESSLLGSNPTKQEQFEAVKRWFYND